VRVDRAGGNDEALAGDHLGAGADGQLRVDAVLDVRVPGPADADETSVLDADVGLHDPEHRIHHDDRGDQQVEHAVGVRKPDAWGCSPSPPLAPGAD
jgi:hypothetical protein